MEGLNYKLLDKIIADYKENFEKYRKDELYKWEAIKTFQDNWNINSDNFVNMLSESLSRSYNLLDSFMYFPKGMILQFAEKETETVREMFKVLFDESKDFEERYNFFVSKSEEILNKYWDEGKNHYQDAHTISIYLTFMYPNKYYIYKPSTGNKIAKDLNQSIYSKDKARQLNNYFNLCNEINEYINDDNELLELNRNSLNTECYKDEQNHVLVMDLLHYGVVSYREKKYWLYAPGENAKLWDECYKNSLMLIGWDETGDLSELKSKKQINEELKKVYNNEGSMKNDTNALYQFSNEIQEGDIIIVKKGIHNLLGYGEVASDYFYNQSRETYKHCRSIRWIKNGIWEVPEDTIGNLNIKTLTDITPYDDYAEKLLKIMDGEETIMENEVLNNGEKYFWLNANPKIWSFSELKNGEIIEYTAVNENGNKRRIYKNYEEARKGDKVIAYESTPTKAIVGVCEVEEELKDNILKIRKLETLVNPIEYKDIINNDELKDMEFFQNSQGSLFKLEINEYNAVMDMIRENNPLAKKVVDTYTKEDFLKDVYINSESYEEIKNLLLRKKNIILQGAPGVGKTYMAKRFAYSINGLKDAEKISCIQFHQSYAYEDFIEGYRPTENGFKLDKGIFYNFCLKAENDPDNKYFFIIDEINRGNLSKIFGELLMLIENDKRNEKLTLAYSKVGFSVPENVYIIGMMNTADRSLAIMDYALRRRFSFYDVEPAFENANFKKYQDSLNSEKLNKTIEKIKRLNEDIEQDTSLGKGFKIGHSYFCNLKKEEIEESINSILKYEIIPMLEEYWFDNINKYENWKNILLGE